ncbi:MAG: TonB-dependent receptor [Porticoccaceae bacterium]|nr:TonB-dependent receptor [Porticoccaceae bacterium]
MKNICASAMMLAGLLISLPLISNTNDDIEEVVVTASLTPILRSRSGNSVSILSREQLQNRKSVGITDLLRDVPGFSVSRVGVLGSQTQVRVRGAEANHLLVLIDGVEANDPSQSDEFSWATVTATDIERIEIIRGPQSSLRGSDAIAGVVNIITPSAEKTGFGLFLERGSRSTQHSGFNLGLKKSDFDVRLGLGHVESHGGNIARSGNEKDGYKNTTLTLKTGAKINEKLSVSLSVRESDGMNQYDADDDYDGLVEDRDRHSSFDNSTRRLQIDYSPFHGSWRHKFLISRSTNDNSAFTDGVEGNITASSKHQYQYVGSVSFADGTRTLSFLAERDQEDWMQRGDDPWGDVNQDRERDTDSLAVEYRTDINDRLTIAVSGRSEKNSEFDSAKTFRAETTYRLTDQTRVRGALGTAIKNPTFTERFGYYTNFIGNPNLVPEKSRSWELGFDSQLSDDNVTLSATIFDSELANEIDGFVYDPTIFSFTSGNMDAKSERRGFELSFVANIWDSFSISSAYTYTHSKDADSADEVRRPKNIASGNLSWEATENLSLNINLQFTGDQTDVFFPPYPESSQVVTMEDHTLLNLNINYVVNDKFEIYVNLDNVLDEDYEEVFGYQTLGFGASMGLRYSL